MKFYVGLCKVNGVIPNDAVKFDYVFISVDELYGLDVKFTANKWIMDSGGFNEIRRYGMYRHHARRYADEINRWADVGELEMAVAQDFPCDGLSRAKTREVLGFEGEEDELIELHQAMSIERYDDLVACRPRVPIMPALQGVTAADYVQHVRMFGDRLTKGMRVGVGALVWRSSYPRQVAEILIAIKRERPDLKLHGLGVKKRAVKLHEVRALMYSSDSMAWRKRAFWSQVEDVTPIDGTWREASYAEKYEKRINRITETKATPIIPFWARNVGKS